MVGERFVELLNGIEGGEVNVSVVEGYDLEDKTGDTVVLGRRYTGHGRNGTDAGRRAWAGQ